MSTPITFSGFNNIDFNQVLNAVMAQASQPLNLLQTQQNTLNSQNSAFTTFAGKLGALETASDALKSQDSLAVLTASSSDSGVGVTTTSGTTTGTYTVAVSSLARAQVLASTSTYSATDDVVATGGTLTLTSGGNSVDVTLSGSTTLQGLADAINGTDGSPVTASVVQTSPGTYSLVLNGNDTGTDNAFTVASTLSGGAGLTFTDTDSNGIYGDSAADNAQTAANASLTVNNVAIESASNTVTDAVPGVSLSLHSAGTTAVVQVSRDSTQAKALVNTVISAYNDLASFLSSQSTAAASGKASIARDPLVTGFKNAIRSTLQGDYSSTGSVFARLAEVGVGFDSTGKMVLDDSTFDTVIASHAQDVQTLFSSTAGDGGAFGALSDLVNTYTESGGLVADAQQRITDQVSAMSKRLDDMQAQLDLQRATLQQQYTAADLAMTQLNGQASSLTQLDGQYRLF
ncbi:MAG TPA: flagellar filament capping protein FliD [Vicinamibacterales bacterium]|nr:flagellar filament capping protein FliD [Vicinamibacterales bacterium]